MGIFSGPKAPKNDPESARSRAVARVVDLLGEGELELCEGQRSVLLDGVPLLRRDGEVSLRGVTLDWRSGTADQPPVEGFSAVESTVPVGVLVTQDSGGVIRVVAEPETDKVKVVLRWDQLVETQKDGDQRQTGVNLSIDVKSAGAADFTQVVLSDFKDKALSPYQRAYVVALPPGGAPWQIRVRRNSRDYSDGVHHSAFQWEAYVRIVEAKLSYPFSALAALTIDSKRTGGRLPERAYEVRRTNIPMPKGYDPERRTYAPGLWDGTFGRGATDNPAWLIWDLVTNDRFGLGAEIAPELCDKWALHEVARYCDELVPDGMGGLEPRFTANLALTDREQALRVLQSFAAIFRGQLAWNGSAVSVAQDRPADAAVLVTQASAEGGKFTYKGAPLATRHSVALVSWRDPKLEFVDRVEAVEDQEALLRFGRRVVEIAAPWCTSRGQARRLGRAALYTERYESETVTYHCGLDHLSRQPVLPGDIVKIADPAYLGARRGGRVVSATTSHLTLDAPVELAALGEYRVSVTLPDGSLHDSAVTERGGSFTRLTMVANARAAALPNATWVLSGSDAGAQTFRVVSLAEVRRGVFQVTALRHHPGKYALIDRDEPFDPEPLSTIPAGDLAAPSKLAAQLRRKLTAGGPALHLIVSLSAASDVRVLGHEMEASREEGSWQPVLLDGNLTAEIVNPGLGLWRLRARAVGAAAVSPWVETSLEVTTDAANLAPPAPRDLQLAGGGTAFAGGDALLTWRQGDLYAGLPPAEGADLSDAGIDPLFKEWAVEVRDAVSNALLRSAVATEARYLYGQSLNLADGGPRRRIKLGVRHRRLNGEESAAAEVTVENPAPPTPAGLLLTAIENGLRLRWSEPADKDALGTRVWLSAASGFTPDSSTLLYEGGGLSAEIGGLAPGTTYYLQLAHYDAFGEGPRTGELVALAGGKPLDVTPPAAPTGLSTQLGIKQVGLFWTNPSDGDLAHVEVLRGTTGSSGAATVIGRATLGFFLDTTVAAGTAYWYWLRAVDRAGNASGLAGPATATARRALNDDLSDAAITATKLASGLSAVESVSVLPPSGNYAGRVVFLTTDGKLYRYNGGWTAAVPAADLTGQIGSTQIADDAITTPKLAAGAVTASELAAGSVLADKIAAGVVTASHIASGTITTDKLVVANGDNLVPNPNFASGDAAGWMLDAGTTGGAVTILARAAGGVPANAPAAYVARGTLEGRLRSHLGQYFPVQPGETYLLTFWAARSSDWNSTFRADVAFLRSDGTSSQTGILLNQALATAWQELSASYTVPADVVGLHAHLRPSSGSPPTAGAYYVTGIRLNRVAGTTLIQDGAVTTAKILAGAVTTNALAAGAVTADRIAAGTITGDRLAAGTITADRIAAGSITTDRLVVANGDNLVPNPDFASGSATGWTLDAGTTGGAVTVLARGAAGVPASAPAAYVARGTLEGRLRSHLTQYIPVQPGEMYLLTFWAARSSDWNGTFRADIAFLRNDGTTGQTAVLIGQAFTTTWAEYSGSYTVPSGIVGIHLQLRPTTGTPPTAGAYYLTAVRLNRVAGTALIGDAAITSAKIASAAVGSAQIADAAITSAKIGTAAIQGAHIRDLTVDNAKIANLTIGTQKITDEAVQLIKVITDSRKIILNNTDVGSPGTELEFAL